MTRHSRSTTRAAFTLVELLVAMALIIFIMAILSTAFAVSMETFRDLKAIGDMSEQMRSTSTIIRRDLAAEHFENAAGNNRRLNAIPTDEPWTGSRKGFFYIRQDSPGVGEGIDPDGLTSVRVSGPVNAPSGTPGHHEFGMTVKLRKKTQSDTFSGPLHPMLRGHLANLNLVDFSTVDAGNNALQFVSEWAEVYYFLRQTAVVTNVANDQTVPLYTLHRRQRVLAPNESAPLPNTGGNSVQYNDHVLLSSSLGLAQVPLTGPPQPPQFRAIGPESLTTFVPGAPPGEYMPANRLGGWYDPHRLSRPGYPTSPPPHTGQMPIDYTNWRPYPIPNNQYTNPEYGSDVVLNNVVSFRIQILTTASGQFQDLPPNLGNPPGTFPRVYDTARPVPATGFKPQIRAMRIQLRVYNVNTGLTRQMSIIQDL